LFLNLLSGVAVALTKASASSSNCIDNTMVASDSNSGGNSGTVQSESAATVFVVLFEEITQWQPVAAIVAATVALCSQSQQW
jgi:hypothetical protein